eukprot:Hpha_TRINITY_DN6243_c0_g1::TRINITY_DN6243_c0_g1_i1::g.23572::m.23572
MAQFVAVDEIRAHIAFLRAVHTSSHDLYKGPFLRSAVSRYTVWLAEKASSGAVKVAIPPPLEIAWCWHCHRLAPVQYIRDCISLGGEVVPDASVAFSWSEEAGPVSAQTEAKIGFDVCASASRQSQFLWQVSGPAYGDHAFLEAAIRRYERFLRLVKVTREDLGATAKLAPPMDVDLVWHTHMLRAHTSTYLSDTAGVCGVALDHDDDVPSTGPSPALEAMWSNTQKHWHAAATITSGEQVTPKEQGGPELEHVVPPGAARRGDPPPWWFDGNEESVVVIDDFLSPSAMAEVLRQMPDPEEAVQGGGGPARGRGFGKDARTNVQTAAEVEFRIISEVGARLGMPCTPQPSLPQPRGLTSVQSVVWWPQAYWHAIGAKRRAIRDKCGHFGFNLNLFSVKCSRGWSGRQGCCKRGVKRHPSAAGPCCRGGDEAAQGSRQRRGRGWVWTSLRALRGRVHCCRVPAGQRHARPRGVGRDANGQRRAGRGRRVGAALTCPAAA